MVRNGSKAGNNNINARIAAANFFGGIRRDKSQVISEYIKGKQTRKQLAERYGVSVRTIEQDLKGMRYA